LVESAMQYVMNKVDFQAHKFRLSTPRPFFCQLARFSQITTTSRLDRR
jgi:hypothetical protein